MAEIKPILLDADNTDAGKTFLIMNDELWITDFEVNILNEVLAHNS